jgi:hypothetical protein
MPRFRSANVLEPTSNGPKSGVFQQNRPIAVLSIQIRKRTLMLRGPSNKYWTLYVRVILG